MRLQFADFTVDTGTRQLHRGGEELHLSPKAFDLLALLLAHRPAVVDKETLRDSLWPGTNVVDTNLNNLVSEIRSALDDDPQQPRFVRTVHRVGFAFCGTVEEVGSLVRSRPVAGDETPRFWLLWNDRTIVIVDPDTVIGRDPKSSIWIDVPGVSRRHASIRVSLNASGDRPTAEIEDLGSTNGTFVDDRLVRGAVALEDGHTIRIGEAMLTFRAWSSAGAATKRIRKVSATRRDR